MKQWEEEGLSPSVLIDRYIDGFPEPTAGMLRTIRRIIRAAAPEATEKISYAMPTLYLYGNLIHFAGYPGHIGLYPAPSGIDAFKDELSRYIHAKGSVRFPLDEPLPEALIARIVAFRVAENTQAHARKLAGKSTSKAASKPAKKPAGTRKPS